MESTTGYLVYFGLYLFVITVKFLQLKSKQHHQLKTSLLTCKLKL